MEFLSGVISDFGLADDPTGDDVVSIEDITSTLGFVPGSEQAKVWWDTNVDPQVNETGTYADRSMEWGEGGSSRYLRDKLIMREGLDPEAAETIVRINYFRKVTIINEAGGNPAQTG